MLDSIERFQLVTGLLATRLCVHRKRMVGVNRTGVDAVGNIYVAPRTSEDLIRWYGEQFPESGCELWARKPKGDYDFCLPMELRGYVESLRADTVESKLWLQRQGYEDAWDVVTHNTYQVTKVIERLSQIEGLRNAMSKREYSELYHVLGNGRWAKLLMVDILRQDSGLERL
jgi:hypothetical protein